MNLSNRGNIFGRSSRQYNDGQEEIGDVYAKAKAICEVLTFLPIFLIDTV